MLSKCDDLIDKLTNLKKSLKEDKEDDKEKEEVDKSDYGPKGAGLYNVADNVRRKMGNTGSVAGQGKNVNVKSYSTRPGQLSAKQQAARAPSGPAGPVKQYTPEQIAAINEARKLKKNAETLPWVRHNEIPSTPKKEKVLKKAEDLMANQLANLMAGRSMLGNTPKQPTDEEMFGHLVPKEEAIKKAEDSWNNIHNDWLKEASKPISSRFNSPEEEEAYWASIKIQDRDDGKSGY